MYNSIKRFIDISTALFLLSVCSPLFLIIFILIKTEDRGPIFYIQKRVGINGHLFDLYKFRSMIHNSQGTFYTQANDPRITKTGKILRRLSLDELPQLFNILKGEMSLVGPRPDVEVQQQAYTLEQRTKRNSVLPGVTGLAQATRRSLATFEERLSFDLEYVGSKSFVLDCKILIWTFKNILKKNGN